MGRKGDGPEGAPPQGEEWSVPGGAPPLVGEWSGQRKRGLSAPSSDLALFVLFDHVLTLHGGDYLQTRGGNFKIQHHHAIIASHEL